jgi:hypothetical protein
VFDGGNCQISCITAGVWGDHNFSKLLKRRVNKQIADHLIKYKEFGYEASEETPFYRELGSGENFSYASAFSNEELKDLLVRGNSTRASEHAE